MIRRPPRRIGRKPPRWFDRRSVTSIPIPPANFLIPFIQAAISPEGETIIAAAIENLATRGGSLRYPPSIVGVAYADAPGSTAAEMELSQQRATAVAEALAALRVPPSKVTIYWNGEPGSANYAGDYGEGATGPYYGGVKICIMGGQ